MAERKRKRPKVRYIARFIGFDPARYEVLHADPAVADRHVPDICHCYTESSAKRIAAALNFYEATKRREI